MHLLPQSFVFQATHSSSQGEPDGTTALLLPAVVQFFRKACRTSSRGRLFRFPKQVRNSGVKAECPVPPALRISTRSWIHTVHEMK
ncbi:hypothetical protein GFL24_12515 [Rhizobium laguerreae]|nr:hypothetical protein [Rhizobium laguerreae]